jgi:AI-2 transport protein TqsA
MATYSVVFIVLIIYLLEKFRDILQPLAIALFLGFLMHPVHRWLVARRFPSMLAYGVILVIVGLSLSAIGSVMYANIAQAAAKAPIYEGRLEEKIIYVASHLPQDTLKLERGFLRDIKLGSDQLIAGARASLGPVRDFSSLTGLTLLYLLFLIVEKVNVPSRLQLALGVDHGNHILTVVDSIAQAISQYITVKTLVSAMAGLLSYIVLATFGIELAATWGILIFLFNYIPYLGSLVAVALPILLSFLQFDGIWQGIVITILLIGIQQGIGTWIEPRMAGQRLDVSPILIVLSLAFWWSIWGIVGAILAVPLLVIVKIILDNIDATKPIAILISNR